jgi:putative hydrolase of the HAD superfamily
VFSSDDIDAVVFDMGGVFLIPDPGRISAIVGDAGVPLDMDGDAAHLAHYTGVRALTELFESIVADETEPDVWHAYDTAYFSAAGVADAHLESAVGARDAYRRSPTKVGHVWMHPLPANIDAFAAVAAVKPVAIVSNNDGTAAEQCLDHAICQVGSGPLPSVAALIDSGVLGIAKPDPRIFTPAIEALDTEPARTLYVGDTVHADVRGAEAAGMPVVQLDPYDLHADHDHWRLPDVVALAALLQ